jgi:hypothetical protein
MSNIVWVDGSSGSIAALLRHDVKSPRIVSCPLYMSSRYASYCHRPVYVISAMRCLHRVPSKTMMSLMSGILGMHGHAGGAKGHGARGGSGALP